MSVFERPMSREMHSVVLNPREDCDRDKKPHARAR